MSQIPPPPFNPGMPPPPAGQYGQPYSPMAPRRTNGMAIASLVCGFLGFCVPFLLGLVAVILGALGIRKANDPQVASGKGLAITGLILGILSLGMWTLFGGGIFALIKGTAPQRDIARQVVTDLAAGNVSAASANTEGLSTEELDKLSTTMKSWGALTDTTVFGVAAEPGKTQVTGVAKFGQTAKSFQAVVVKGADGKLKVTQLHFQ